MKSGFKDLFLPWAGLVVATLAGAFVHQFGSDGSFDNCALFVPEPVLIVAFLGLLAAIAGGLASARVLRGEAEAPGRKVIATISVGASALFVLAIVLPMIAALIIPPCFQ